MGQRPKLFNSGSESKQGLHPPDSGATELGVEWAEDPNLSSGYYEYFKNINSGYYE